MIRVHTNLEVPYVSADLGRAVVGDVRAVNGQLQVHNGSTFVPIHANAWIDDDKLNTMLNWVMKKMDQELEEEQLAKQFPAFAKAKENYEIVKALVKDETN